MSFDFLLWSLYRFPDVRQLWILNPSKTVFLTMVLLGVIGLLYVGSDRQENKGKRVTVEVDYMHYDLSRLKQDASAIVVGNVETIAMPYGHPDLNDITTIFNFKVSSYVKGPDKAQFTWATTGGLSTRLL